MLKNSRNYSTWQEENRHDDYNYLSQAMVRTKIGGFIASIKLARISHYQRLTGEFCYFAESNNIAIQAPGDEQIVAMQRSDKGHASPGK
jgi:hypothetical protein